jgi:hypothetical protein
MSSIDKRDKHFSGFSTSILLFFRSTKSPERILEVLFPEKRRRESSLSRASAPALIAGERSSAGPILPFFIFPGTVLPFSYFSVVRKVPEKPVLFLPDPFLYYKENEVL